MSANHHEPIPLHQVSADDHPLIGGKAAKLGELMQAGFTVPDGFVLPKTMLDEVLATIGGSPAEELRTVALPAHVEAAIAAVAESFDGVPVAVRSTGIAEDLADSSFAGQYDTVLDVHGVDAMVSAVRTCWASAFSARVAGYRKLNAAAPESHEMAVLIQRLVDADAAGVAFSANPVTGNRQEAVVSAVTGLGDKLVSGEATPEEWTFAADEVRGRPDTEEAIGPGVAAEVAALVRQVSRHYGDTPYDIEWAVKDGQVWLLQARPITTLPEPQPDPVPVPIEVPPGQWRKHMFYTRPMCRLQSSMYLDQLNRSMRHLFTNALGPRFESREIGGWLYRQMTFQPPTPEQRAEVIAGIRDNKRAAIVRRWKREWEPELLGWIDRIGAVDLTTLLDVDLVAHLDEVEKLNKHTIDVHFLAAAEAALVVAEFGLVAEELLGWDPATVLGQLTGVPSKTTEPSERLAELAAEAAALPEVRELLTGVDETTLPRIAGVAPAFAVKFDRYLRDYGRRLMQLYITDPTIAEQPALVLNLLAQQLDQDATTGTEPTGTVELEQARKTLAERSGPDLARFDEALANARDAYPVRDDTNYYLMIAHAHTRYTALEIGRRMVERGHALVPEDAFLFDHSELLEGFAESLDLRDRIIRRRGERRWIDENPGPVTYGEAPAGGPHGGGGGAAPSDLPAELRYVQKLNAWVASTQGTRGDASDGGLSGVGVSTGRYTGPVRIVHDLTEFDRVKRGDVLVCPDTTAQWSVLFGLVKALVTDKSIGGLLSHPAIIAREYGIPAVVGTGNGTETLRDGQIVTVDGAKGQVEVLA